MAASAIGFGVVIAELIRIAHALEADQASRIDMDPVEASQPQPA